jgi:eukaryotic-like serine/threonine-protein kinase
VAFVREQSAEPHNNWSIGLVAVDGSSEQLFAREHSPLSHLRWSPDGRSVWAVRRRSALGEEDDLLQVDLKSGNKTTFAAPAPGGRISLPVWVGESRTLLFAQTGHLPSSRVVLFTPGNGRSRTLFWFPSLIDVIAPLGEDRLIFDAIDVYQNLGESAPAGGSQSERWLTHGTSVDRQPIYSPDGRSLVFSSNRSGNIDLWRLSSETGSLKRLTKHPADDWDPAFSPDGRLLVWSSNRSEGLEIFVADADGHNPRQLTHGASAENPTVTADGQWVIYSSGRLGMAGVCRIRLDGTEDHLVTASAKGHPDVSPDGRHVVFRTQSINGVTTLRVAEVESGAVLPADARIEAAGHRIDPWIILGRARWLPDGRGVAFIALTEAGHVGLVAQDFDPRRGLVGRRRTLLEGLPDLPPESFGVAADGRLAVSFIRRSSNLMTDSGLPLDELRP